MLPGTPVRVIEPADLPAAVTAATLVLPDEDITRNLAAEHHLGEGRELVFDKTFLRWDREWSQARRPADFDGKLAVAELPGAARRPRHGAGRPQLGLVAAGRRHRLARRGDPRRRVEPPLPDRVRPLRRRGPEGRLQPRRPGRPVHRHPRGGVRRSPRPRGRARPWTARTSTSRRSPARRAPASSRSPASAAATSPAPTQSLKATTSSAPRASTCSGWTRPPRRIAAARPGRPRVAFAHRL